jgi:signal transduction histidine kinase
MSTTATAPRPEEHGGRPGRARPALDRVRLGTGVAGLALLAGLALVVAPAHDVPAAILALVIGIGLTAVLVAPAALAALRRHPGVALLLTLVLAWIGVWAVANGLRLVSEGSPEVDGLAYSWLDAGAVRGAFTGAAWPWRDLVAGLAPLALVALTVTGGVVLVADAVRSALGTDETTRGPWRLMTAPPTRRTRVAGSALGGITLVAVAALFSIGLLDRATDGDPLLEGLVVLAVAGGAAVLVGSPVLVGLLTRADHDQAGRAREEERQRFAAHLHDSVLQTLALVQRQAHDPAAVARLARRQEHALRAWMAGESELVSETLGAAIREVVADVEDEHGVTIECTAIGDRPLDRAGEALAGAAREALRNAARHAAGAPVLVFCELSPEGAAVFVRDQGPGFDPEAVAPERRGIRDAIVGRMAAAGGTAGVESAPGQGTEVTLLIGEPGTDGR